MRRPLSAVFVLFVGGIATAANAQVLQPNRASHLAGVRNVSVWVSVSANEPAPVTTVRLRQVAEERIREAGLPVIAVPLEPSADRSAFVEVALTVVDIRSATQKFGYAFWTSVKLRAGGSTVLWEQGQLNVCEVPDGQRAIEAAAGALLDQFLSDWQKANPKT